MKSITINSYGKINIYLDVLGVREDGYHEIETVMQHIELHDDVLIRFFPNDYADEIEIGLSTNRPYLPTNEKNLAYRAAQMMIEKYGERMPKGRLKIDIKKRIPVAAGLAGGSGNAAAVLLGMNKLFDLDVDLTILCQLGGKLGSDVPFCIMGQAKNNKVLGSKINNHSLASSCALAMGRGTELIPLHSLSINTLISKPALRVSTKEVYDGIDKELESQGNDIARPNKEEVIAGLNTAKKELIYRNMINLLEIYTLKGYPIIIETKKKFEETKPQKVLMSGSGPTVFAFYENKEQAEEAYKVMKAVNRETFLTKTLQ